jgi:hypothetical protein
MKELEKKQLIQICGKHTVQVEEANHHQANM